MKRKTPTQVLPITGIASKNIPGAVLQKKLPEDIKPMLATLVESPFDQEGWIYEIKWDGYRALSYLNAENTEIRSRNNKSFNEKFYPITEVLKKLPINAVLDGEIIAVNESGYPDFSALQTWRSEADGKLIYYVFDILWMEGTNLMDVSLEERRKILQNVLPESETIRLSKNFETKGDELFDLVNKMGLEGIIAKKKSSLYLSDSRSPEWLKIKTKKFQEAVIGGYTKNENTSKLFSALLLGRFEGKDFVYTGNVGTGFSTMVQKAILEKLEKLKINKAPFNEIPEFNKPSRFRPNPPKADVTWVKPEVVAEISYRTVSSDGTFRHPSFKGLRVDKNAKDVVKEIPLVTKSVVIPEDKSFEQKVTGKVSKLERNSLLNPSQESQVRKIHGHELKFSNLSKIFWPDEGFTKRDLLNYYYQIAPYILPYLKDRPQTLNRFPNGITSPSFYQKDVKGKIPGWINTFAYHSDKDEKDKEFIVCNEEAALLYIAGLGCIEMNPWSSRISNPDHPDWCIIDLDPDTNSFEQVIITANEVKSLLDSIGVTSCCKTSGSTGLHIYIPFGAKYTYEESKEFGRSLVKVVNTSLPKFTSIERPTAARKGKIYLDFLQNRPQATVASAYSVRPKPGATVSMPLHWDEIKKGLKMKDFTIRNAAARVKETGDLFKGVLGKGINLSLALKKLTTIANS